MSEKDPRGLPKVLGPLEALCVIVGSVIGSGIFIVPAKIANQLPSMVGIGLVWILGGLFTLAGALTLAELSAMMPHAGGPYVYLREAYGRLPAFLFGWTELLVIRAGSMATLAAAFAIYFAQLFPAPSWLGPELWKMSAAVMAIAVVAAINVLGTKFGSSVQVVGTALKVGALGSMIALPFVLGRASSTNFAPVMPKAFDGSMFRGIMIAMVAVLWAYDGWVNSTELAEEVRDPGRNMPRALIMGALLLIVIYVTMSFCYHLVLPIEEVEAASTEKGSGTVVAAEYCRALLGPRGVTAIALVVMCSTFISLNGNALSGPRAYFAMARDGLFPQSLCTIHPRYQTPANAVLAQSVWGIVLSVAATVMILAPPPPEGSTLPAPLLGAWKTLNKTPLYDVLYEYVIFGGTLFYTMGAASVFVLRRSRPDWPRPYRTWGYPITPLLYIAAAFLLMGHMLIEAPVGSLSGLALIVLGLPVYLVFVRKRRKPESAFERSFRPEEV
jgi:APA family basic amino acid/polyamine antiporter